MSIYSRTRPQSHLRRDGFTWCGIKIRSGVAVLKTGVNPAAIGISVCKRCTRAHDEAKHQPELPWKSDDDDGPRVTYVGNLHDLLAQACAGGSS